ncbi:MAG: hypothetical protein LBH59_01010 [Planctomycetaceae bacterium]|jgi:hypothetical protein|nr:hypothetical protein [Planctomycetaceae bacterium]
MSTPTPDKLGIYYASKYLDSSGNVTERFVDNPISAISFTVLNISEPTDSWNGAVGYFTETTTTTLRGVTFHVRKWDKESNTLTLSAPLPVTPTNGEKFVLFVGGKQISNKEVLCMKVSGKQPEIESVKGTNITGVTIKKVSPILGEGTLYLNYLYSTRELQIRMGTSGDYGPTVAFTNDAQNIALFSRDMVGYILIDVAAAQLPTSNRTDTFTITTPKGNMIPNYEGYETNDGVGRTRYHLFVTKNRATEYEDAISGLMVWTGKPAGVETTLSSSYSVPTTSTMTMTVANAATWPSRGFWIKNKTIAAPKYDLRYVDYRSGNNLYIKPVVWATAPFREGNSHLQRGAEITTSYSTTDNAIIDQVIITSGSLNDGNASGILYLKKYSSYSSYWYSGYEIRIKSSGLKCAVTDGYSVRGYRNCTAVTWNSSNIIEPASDIDIGIEYPNENGLYSDPPNENIMPNVDFECADEQLKNIFAGPLFPSTTLGLWIRETILDGTQARQNIEGDISLEWY